MILTQGTRRQAVALSHLAGFRRGFLEARHRHIVAESSNVTRRLAVRGECLIVGDHGGWGEE